MPAGKHTFTFYIERGGLVLIEIPRRQIYVTNVDQTFYPPVCLINTVYLGKPISVKYIRNDAEVNVIEELLVSRETRSRMSRGRLLTWGLNPQDWERNSLATTFRAFQQTLLSKATYNKYFCQKNEKQFTAV